MSARRDAGLAVALVASLALAATTLWAPHEPWRVPLAILGGVWAPGYALLAAVYPRGALSAVERHALAAGAGFCLLPILSLLASETVGLSGPRVAVVGAACTLVLALVGWRRRAERTEPLMRTAFPSTRLTLVVVTLALALAVAVEAQGRLSVTREPPSLGIRTDAGPLDLRPDVDEPIVVLIEARAGADPLARTLVVSWAGEVVAERALELPAGERALTRHALDTREEGSFTLVVTWGDLRTHATFVVGGG